MRSERSGRPSDHAAPARLYNSGPGFQAAPARWLQSAARAPSEPRRRSRADPLAEPSAHGGGHGNVGAGIELLPVALAHQEAVADRVEPVLESLVRALQPHHAGGTGVEFDCQGPVAVVISHGAGVAAGRRHLDLGAGHGRQRHVESIDLVTERIGAGLVTLPRAGPIELSRPGQADRGRRADPDRGPASGQVAGVAGVARVVAVLHGDVDRTIVEVLARYRLHEGQHPAGVVDRVVDQPALRRPIADDCWIKPVAHLEDRPSRCHERSGACARR